MMISIAIFDGDIRNSGCSIWKLFYNIIKYVHFVGALI